jgi:ketosteroid isomerase-like protein
MSQQQKDFVDVLAARYAALRARDAAAFVAIYAPGAVVYDLAPPLAHPPDEASVAAWMASWDGPIVGEMRHGSVAVAQGIGYIHGLERLSGRQGGEDRDVWLRLTLCLELGASGWRVTHEHTSVPMRKQGGTLIGAIDLKP